MATLSADVEARYSAQLILDLTNPDVEGATTKDSGRLTKASDDVEADFRIIAGITYDSTDSRHVSVAIDGVVAKLIERNGKAGNVLTERVSRWTERLEQLALVTSRDRVTPTTSSIQVRSSEQTGTETVRPQFDTPKFDDIFPEAPGVGEDS